MKYPYLLMFATLMSLTSCKTTYVVNTAPVEVMAPDSLPDPPPSANGWAFVRSSSHGGKYVPPVPTGKIKNSFNTDNSQKKSNNDESVVKDKTKTKAKDAGVIGNGNEVKQSKGIPPLLIYIGLGLLIAAAVGYGIYRMKKV
ncbi:hypothetical protein GCM10023188_25640 [Pontibacter saemangeumensis]|uniref:MYXO-CTERM domain-containing protein n=1 Tax=Pontibacter saemangeumensis TaxID=1084525 RepID=A0ABP8LTN9_9BACT